MTRAKAVPGVTVTEHVYTDDGGAPVLKVVRKDRPGKKKLIHQERHEGPAGWVRGGLVGEMKDRQPLLGLPEIVGQPETKAVIVEGERCVDAIRDAWPGTLATTWPGGTSAWRKADWSVLGKREVSILADADDVGRRCARGIAELLAKQGCTVSLALPEGDSGEDVADWLSLGAAAARRRVASLLKPFRKPATSGALPAAVALDSEWIDGNDHYRVLGTDQDKACFRLRNGQIYEPRADRLTLPGTLIRLAPRVLWCAKTGEEKVTAEVGRMIGDVLTRAADARGPFELDPDPGLSGLPDGRIVNLRNGEIRAADRSDDRYVLGSLGAVPQPGEPELWLRSLSEMFRGHEEFVPWLKRWMGYCLTGYTREHKFVLLHGPSGTGKSTLQAIIERCAGTYFRGLSKRGLFGEHGDHAEHIARLRGARLAIADDVPSHGWRHADIKSLVSGETMTARGMAEGSRDFESRVKLIMSCNDLPEISDAGITGRIMPVEMCHVLRGREPKRRYELLRELPRILHWAIEGAGEWYREGLGSTSVLDSAVLSFERIGDRIGAWLDDCCELEETFEEPTQALLVSFREWAARSGGKGVSTRTLHTYFGRMQRGTPVWPKRLRDGKSRGFGGVRIRHGA